MSDSTSRSGGIGFVGLLQVLSIGLKLGHVIDWPWMWVLAPIWISWAIALVVIIPVAIYPWVTR